MKICPKCKNYMSFIMTYSAMGSPIAEYNCGCCGYSSRNEYSTIDSKSHVYKNQNNTNTNLTDIKMKF